MPEFGQLACTELCTTGARGTDPARGGNIDVYIVFRERCSRVMIITGEVVIIIDGPLGASGLIRLKDPASHEAVIPSPDYPIYLLYNKTTADF